MDNGQSKLWSRFSVVIKDKVRKEKINYKEKKIIKTLYVYLTARPTNHIEIYRLNAHQ